MKQQILTASEIIAWKTCRKRWWFSYNQCLEPLVLAKALSYGSAVHKILATYYSCKTLPRFSPGTYDASDEEGKFIIKEINCLVDAYIQRDPLAEDFRPVNVEEEFIVGVPSPKGYRYKWFQFAGKIDLTLKDAHGNLWLVDHKTSIKALDPQWLELADQMKYYLWAKNQLGSSPVGIQYNLIRKPSIRPHKNDTPEIYAERLSNDIESRPEFYFQQQGVVKMEKDIEAIGLELWQLAHEVGKGPIYQNPGACQILSCPYSDLCVRDTTITRTAGFKVSKRHRELNEVTREE